MLELAISLRDLLASEQCRLVLVESCTAGRVAATLGELPGISQWLCGSLVVYRNASKSAWLGVPDSLLDDPQQGPVS
ncbi:MAG: CinA family protein, partial [Planctomycetales bacterium]|nr:CinA family protein [Planctomycetales bacterium]